MIETIKSPVNYPKIGGIYEHYKGGIYEIITLCEHTETKEQLVIYKSINFGTVYARPLSQFFERINGRQIETGKCNPYRFVLK